MGRRVRSTDVLDPDAKIRRAFWGRVLGHFRRTGPNAWDDYEYVAERADTIEVLPGIKIQMERRGADFRMRSEGRVIRVRWVPTDEEQDQLSGAGPKELRERFLADYVSLFDEPAGRGAAAVIASKLKG